VDLRERLLASLDVSLIKGMWRIEDEIIKKTQDADAVIGAVSIHPFSRRVLGALPKCRVIGGIAIGYNTTNLEAATAYGIVLTNVLDYCMDEVSGLAIGWMLSLDHKIPQIDQAIRESPSSTLNP
jgi:D-3-phosphoglycerate dehydrogenase